ncbi:MAG: non-canonical purine NTP pyrophosphatase, RdgB/HAM1 family [Deltaproteobacteria bacterium RIFCSPHIGHO2_02_FULL_50_15]|nr:MAG: non-canonical purine NTP pyrophosphatase, RdgB/HAM1 family [Deltaproteobacteria bacterium RIFCSPHIGHO2_02_FULL_50_15]
MELVIASNNSGKIKEISTALRSFPLAVRQLSEFPRLPPIVEDQKTFEGNALKKARSISQFIGKLTLADDSGLIVPHLKGQPGIYSARYAGPQATDEENNQKLLQELQEVTGEARQAIFTCYLALVHPSGQERVIKGECEGMIATELQGRYGFGYDPLFFIPSLQKTMAQLSLAEKMQWSHRGQALSQLKEILPEFLERPS